MIKGMVTNLLEFLVIIIIAFLVQHYIGIEPDIGAIGVGWLLATREWKT